MGRADNATGFGGRLPATHGTGVGAMPPLDAAGASKAALSAIAPTDELEMRDEAPPTRRGRDQQVSTGRTHGQEAGARCVSARDAGPGRERRAIFDISQAIVDPEENTAAPPDDARPF